MRQAITRVHRLLALMMVLGVLVQFYLAGMVLFGAGITFEPHRTLGYALFLPAQLMLVLAVVGGLGWRVLGMSVALEILMIVQVILPSLRTDASWVAALHPINALMVMGVSAAIARHGRSPWRSGRWHDSGNSTESTSAAVGGTAPRTRQ